MKRFVADQAGSITPLILPLFLLLIFATGFAIDLVRFEAQRADLQNALDRGVLAATALNQELPAQTIVDDYLETRTFANYEATSQVTPSGNAGSKTIDAHAQYNFNTAFMNMVGVPDIGLGAGAAATEGSGLIEISLILDISGSMAREYTGGTTSTRLEILQEAASEFVDTMLAPGAQAYTTISLIPYSGEVNAGPFFDLMLNGAREHDYSSCVKFSDLDFAGVELPPQNSLSQAQNFQWFSYERLRGQTGFPFDPDGGRNAEWGWCPGDDVALLPFRHLRSS